MKEITIKTAVLVVDVQKGLFNQKKPVYNEMKLLNNIIDIINCARSRAIPVIFVQHSNKGILKMGSEGWQFHPSIKPESHECIVQKNNGSAFKETNLEDLLEKNNIHKLIILGLTTHGCVKVTCIDALNLGFEVVVVEDAHSSYSENANELIEKWNRKLSEKGIVLKSTYEIVDDKF